MVLDERERRELRKRAHNLKPVVLIGQKGLHTGILDEIQGALEHHELIKIRFSGGREALETTIGKIIANTGADVIQKIGGVATLYLEKSATQT